MAHRIVVGEGHGCAHRHDQHEGIEHQVLLGDAVWPVELDRACAAAPGSVEGDHGVADRLALAVVDGDRQISRMGRTHEQQRCSNAGQCAHRERLGELGELRVNRDLA